MTEWPTPAACNPGQGDPSDPKRGKKLQWAADFWTDVNAPQPRVTNQFIEFQQSPKLNVDTPKTINTVEWFFGYGGNHLGLSRVVPGMRLVAACEIEAFGLANMVAKMEAGLLEPIPIWSDCKSFPAKPFIDNVGLFIASYPCQGFSCAGLRLGADDPRHLWPYVRRFVQIARPEYCFFENVEGHVSLGLSTVLSDMEEDGYERTWGIFSAAEVRAPHGRKRVFILGRLKDSLAHALGPRLQGSQQLGALPDERDGAKAHGPASEFRRVFGNSQLWPSRPGQPQFAWEPPRVVGGVADSSRELLDGTGDGRKSRGNEFADEGRGGQLADPESGTRLREAQRPSGHVAQQNEGDEFAGQVEQPLGRGPSGRPSRMDYAKLCVSSDSRVDELRLLGNGVVPATAALAWVTLLGRLNKQ